ncbi:MAG: FliH/SctL family protein [Stappiaceae bacterium]
MTSGTGPARFLFDTNFAAPEPVEQVAEPVEPVEPTITVREHEALLKEAEARAFERGNAEGIAEGEKSAAATLAQETNHLVEALQQILAGLDSERDRLEKDAVGLSFLVARRFAAHLIAREPLAEVIALISECLGPLRKAPHMVIRVNEKHAADLKVAVDKLADHAGFQGRLVILGEPDIGRGDCRIEWADGGIVRDRKETEKQIESSIRRYFTAGGPGEERQRALASKTTPQ